MIVPFNETVSSAHRRTSVAHDQSSKNCNQPGSTVPPLECDQSPSGLSAPDLERLTAYVRILLEWDARAALEARNQAA
jgi:hypothetical protein